MNASGSGIGLNPLMMALGSPANPSNHDGLTAVEPFSTVLDQYHTTDRPAINGMSSSQWVNASLGQSLPLSRQELPSTYALSVADLLTQIDGLVVEDLERVDGNVAPIGGGLSQLSLLIQPEAMNSTASLIAADSEFVRQEHSEIAQETVAAVMFSPVVENRHQTNPLSVAIATDEFTEDASVSSDLFRTVSATVDGGDGVDAPPGSLGIERKPEGITVSIASASSPANPLMSDALAAQAATPDQGSWQSSTALDNSLSSVSMKTTAADVNLQQQLNLADARLNFGRDTEQWTPALGGRILAMVADGIQEARIHLDPPELGSLEIRMRIQNDQATVQIQVQTPQVRDVLESQAQRLRDSLAEQGLQLAGFDVSEQGQQGFAKQAPNQPWEQQTDGELSEENEGDAVVKQSTHNGLLDTFA
ncbi:MAG: flagellar hook-length control protein FliK [Bacterioplanes sp.]|nr:flagellar hook-length control protein FliK [Bacterioplanes sp.]